MGWTGHFKQSFCLRFVISIRLETGIPSKVSRPPGFHNFPLKIRKKEWMKKYTHIQGRRPFNKILTSVLPLKSCTGSSLPAEKAKVQRAHADLSSNPARSLYRPTTKQVTWLQSLDSSLHLLWSFKYLCPNISAVHLIRHLPSGLSLSRNHFLQK